MLEWLLAPIDSSRIHDVNWLIAWHGRFMVLAWGTLIPLGILAARFFKVMPHQNWPQVLDNKIWWYCHLTLQCTASAAMLVGLGLILYQVEMSDHTLFNMSRYDAHQYAGWSIVIFGSLQFLSGWLRGSKGGPTEASMRGDHYDMTRQRKVFEYFHKHMGYALLLLSVFSVLSGLWQSNAPVWMWSVLIIWWLCLLAVFIRLQACGYALDTYQAIWGPDKTHPGNNIKPIGRGIKRHP